MKRVFLLLAMSLFALVACETTTPAQNDENASQTKNEKSVEGQEVATAVQEETPNMTAETEN